MKKIDFDLWEAKYKPISNPNHPEKVIEFERKEVQSYDNSRIWSLIQGDFEETIITGYHIVNVIHFYVTEVPHDFKKIEVPVWTDQDEKERLIELILPQCNLTEQELNSMTLYDLFELENKL